MESIPMIIWCQKCFERHIDEGMFAVSQHHTQDKRVSHDIYAAHFRGVSI